MKDDRNTATDHGPRSDYAEHVKYLKVLSNRIYDDATIEGKEKQILLSCLHATIKTFKSMNRKTV